LSSLTTGYVGVSGVGINLIKFAITYKWKC
jgi:hypothetical protein